MELRSEDKNKDGSFKTYCRKAIKLTKSATLTFTIFPPHVWSQEALTVDTL